MKHSPVHRTSIRPGVRCGVKRCLELGRWEPTANVKRVERAPKDVTRVGSTGFVSNPVVSFEFSSVVKAQTARGCRVDNNPTHRPVSSDYQCLFASSDIPKPEKCPSISSPRVSWSDVYNAFLGRLEQAHHSQPYTCHFTLRALQSPWTRPLQAWTAPRL